MQSQENFIYRIIQFLPQTWVNNFQVYEALNVLSISDIIFYCIKAKQLDKKSLQMILEFCIMSSHPSTPLYEDNYPSDILISLYHSGFKFDGKLYALICSDKCIDLHRILSLLYTKPAQLIQKKVLEWLYHPNGPIMKKAEKHFYSIV